MEMKAYNKFLKGILLSVILIPVVLTAQVTLDKNGISPASMKFQQGNQPTVASFFQE